MMTVLDNNFSNMASADVANTSSCGAADGKFVDYYHQNDLG